MAEAWLLDWSIDRMHDPIAGKHVKPSDEGLAGVAGQLDELVRPGGSHLFAAGRGERGASRWNILALKFGADDDMSCQYLLQGHGVCQQSVQRLLGDLLKCAVCRREHSERSVWRCCSGGQAG